MITGYRSLHTNGSEKRTSPRRGSLLAINPLRPGSASVQRTLTLLVVALVHAGVLALLIRSTLEADRPVDRNGVEVVFIAPTAAPRVRADRLRPQTLAPNLLTLPSAPRIAASAEGGSQAGAHPGNNGLNADWLAEAHRAVKAYEIRRDGPPANPMSGASRDYWELQRQHVHQAGDRYKTENGDWIVWLDDHCYEIASWHRGDPSYSPSNPKVVCPERPVPPASATQAE